MRAQILRGALYSPSQLIGKCTVMFFYVNCHRLFFVGGNHEI